MREFPQEVKKVLARITAEDFDSANLGKEDIERYGALFDAALAKIFSDDPDPLQTRG